MADGRADIDGKRSPLKVVLIQLCWIATMPMAGVAGAEEPIAEQPTVQSLDRYEAEQERLKKMLQGAPKAYVDKVMVTGDLPAIDPDGAEPAADAQGHRFFVSESRLNTASQRDGLGRRTARDLGQRIVYRQETANHGVFGLEADVRAGSRDWPGSTTAFAPRARSHRLALRNIGYPLTTRVFADASVGDLTSDVTIGLGRAYRLSLGTRPVRGAGVRLLAHDFDVRAGVGQRVSLAGGPFAGVERLRGQIGWLGASLRLDSGVVLAAQANRAAGVPEWENWWGDGGASHDVGSLAAAAGFGRGWYEEGALRARVIHVRSRVSGTDAGMPSAAQGWFAEAATTLRGLRHEAGGYAAGRNLRFGDYLLPSDNRGVYWRLDGSRLRSSWGAGWQLDETNPHQVGGPASRQMSFQANGDVRLNLHASIGGVLQAERRRDSGGAQWRTERGGRSIYASGYWQTSDPRSGRTRVRLTLRRSQVLVAAAPPATGEELEVEQDWIRGRRDTARPELVTSLGLAWDRSDAVTTRKPTAGVVARAWPTPDWSVSATLRYTARNSNLSTSRGLAGSLESDRVLPGGWRIGAALTLNQAVIDASPVHGLPRVFRSNEKVLSVFARWEAAWGSTSRGVGQRYLDSAGTGTLQGTVFLDENRDGEQQPGEQGAADVEVLLDGRFATSTDRLGRFVFPVVPTGRHRVTVRLDSVPLPWATSGDQGWSTEVPLRGDATVPVPLIRIAQ